MHPFSVFSSFFSRRITAKKSNDCCANAADNMMTMMMMNDTGSWRHFRISRERAASESWRSSSRTHGASKDLPVSDWYRIAFCCPIRTPSTRAESSSTTSETTRPCLRLSWRRRFCVQTTTTLMSCRRTMSTHRRALSRCFSLFTYLRLFTLSETNAMREQHLFIRLFRPAVSIFLHL